MNKTNDGKQGGLLHGKPHYDENGNPLGGIKAVVTDDGNRPVELETGESVIRKSAMESDKEFIVKGTPKEIASTLNQAFGGRAIGDEEAEIIKEFGLGGGLRKSKKNNTFEPITINTLKDVISGKIGDRQAKNICSIANYIRKNEDSISEDRKINEIKQKEIELIKQYALENNFNDLFLDNVDFINENNYISEGAEQKVYFWNEKKVLKINDSIFFNSWLDYLDNLILHNYFFSDTPYELIGFTEIDGVFCCVLIQPFVESDSETDLSKVKELMSENNFENIRNNDFYNKELGLTIEDLHEGNVLTYQGNLFFIDTVFYLDKNKYKLGGSIKPNFSKMSKAEIKEFYNSPEGKRLDKETYAEWKSLVNMTKAELKAFYDSKEGKEAGLSPSEAKEQGIDSGRESARWIMKMKDIPYTEWTDKMWIWAKKQIRFIKRMSGVKGDLYDDNGIKTPKHTALLIWGHNPEKMEYGGDINDNDMDEIKAIIEEFHLGGDMSKHLAPNGKPSNLNHEQWHLVRTPQFKAWFGDWENDPENASKVVDENGEPLVVYHSTDYDFNTFELRGVSQGFFFTPYLKDDEFDYELNYLKSFFLKIKKLDKRQLLSNQWGVPYYENNIISESKKEGFDGLKIFNSQTDKYIIICFNPNQIKLADGTNTTFDSNSDDIRYGLGGGIEREVPKYAMIDDEQFEVIGVNYDLDKVRVKNFASGDTFEMPIDKWIIESFELGTPAKFKANGKEYSGEVVMRDGQKSISLYKDENYSGDAERIIPIREVDISTLKPTMKKEIFEDGGGIEFDMPKNEIQKGAEHEKEHLDTLEKVYEHKLTPEEGTKEVALDHISEIPDYYERLEEVEKPRTIKECLLSDNDDENDFLVEGTKVASNDGDNSQTWEVLSLNKDGLTLKHITKSVLSISLEDKYISYSELRNMFSAGLISINGIDNLRMLNVCIKAVQNCIDKMDLMDHSSSLEKQLEAKEFIDEVKEMHENIDEVILKNGTHIDGEDLMETGGEVNGKNDIFEPSESQEEKERKIMEAQFGVDNI